MQKDTLSTTHNGDIVTWYVDELDEQRVREAADNDEVEVIHEGWWTHLLAEQIRLQTN